MYCKKCKFHAFDHLEACPKCGGSWEEARKALDLNWLTASTNWSNQPESILENPAFGTAPGSGIDLSAEFDADMAMLDFTDPEPPTPPVTAQAVPEPPAPPQYSTALDIAHFPELELSLDMSEASPLPEPAIRTDTIPIFAELELKPLPTPEQLAPPQLLLPPEAPQESIELDFSLDFEEADGTIANSGDGSKRGDLFIPELEEMLMPLEDTRPTPKTKSGTRIIPEEDIFLDFDLDDRTASATPTATALELELKLIEQAEKR